MVGTRQDKFIADPSRCTRLAKTFPLFAIQSAGSASGRADVSGFVAGLENTGSSLERAGLHPTQNVLSLLVGQAAENGDFGEERDDGLRVFQRCEVVHNEGEVADSPRDCPTGVKHQGWLAGFTRIRPVISSLVSWRNIVLPADRYAGPRYKDDTPTFLCEKTRPFFVVQRFVETGAAPCHDGF